MKALPITEDWYLFSGHRRNLARVLRNVIGDERGSVLDVGCGSGTLAKELFGRTIAGVDLRQEACVAAAANDVNAVIGDATALPFADSSFELVYCIETIQYVADLPAALAEMARVCQPGGRVIITTTNRSSLARALTRRMPWFVHHDIIRRTVEDFTQATSMPLGRAWWLLSPFPGALSSKSPTHPLSWLGSNIIVQFSKSDS